MLSPRFKVLASAFLGLSLVGCMQTTHFQGQDRQQLIMIPEKMWHKNADKAYQEVVNDLSKNGSLVYDPRLTSVMQKLQPVAYQYRPDARDWNW